MTMHSPDLDAERLSRLSEEVARIAGDLAALSLNVTPNIGERPSLNASVPGDQEFLRGAVRGLIRARRARAKYMSSELFAEPAWDMLLDLFDAELSNRRVCVSSLCIASCVPATTGLRWLTTMIRQGVFIRRPDPRDGRRAYVELAPEVSEGLRQYFSDIVQPFRISLAAGALAE